MSASSAGIQLFEDKKIRTAWDAEKEEWYFSIVDVIAVLTDSADPAAYWRKLKQRLDALQAGYDTVNIQGRPPSWRNVIVVFAAKTAAADDGMDVITLDAERVERLRTVFWDMTTISTSTESIDHPDTDLGDGIDDSHTESVLTITINGPPPRI